MCDRGAAMPMGGGLTYVWQGVCHRSGKDDASTLQRQQYHQRRCFTRIISVSNASGNKFMSTQKMARD